LPEVAKVDKGGLTGLYEKPKSERTSTPAEFDEIGEKIRETLAPLVISCVTKVRQWIGVNHGSLAERMLFTYGDTPEGMVESALNLFHRESRLPQPSYLLKAPSTRDASCLSPHEWIVIDFTCICVTG